MNPEIRAASERPAAPTLYTARWVLPITRPVIERGAVLVDGERISRVGREVDVRRELAGRTYDTVALETAALLPGFVNVHTHIELTLLRGLCEDVEFFPWIRRLTRIKYECLDAEAYRTAALWGAVEAIQGGVTSVGDASDRGVALDALRVTGLRGIAYEEVFGPDSADADERLRELEERVLENLPRQTQRARLGVSPHAPYTVSPPLYQRTMELAREHSLPVCTHVAESAAEAQFLRQGQGPFADYLEGRGIPVQPRGKTPIQHLDDLGVLAERTLLVHAVRLEGGDVERIRSAGASVAHCPKSNAKLGHGVAPLAELLAAGVPVGIGTDGAVSSNSCDLLEEARFACLTQRGRPYLDAETRGVLHAAAVLELATIGGAKALGLDADVGSLEPGKRADLVAVDLSGPGRAPVYDVAAALVFGAAGRDVVLTTVDGRILYRGGRVLALDAAALAQEVELHRARVEEAVRRLTS